MELAFKHAEAQTLPHDLADIPEHWQFFTVRNDGEYDNRLTQPGRYAILAPPKAHPNLEGEFPKSLRLVGYVTAPERGSAELLKQPA